MKLIRTTAEMAAVARAWGQQPVILVPTMGALHAGHLSLIDTARQTAGEAGTVVVSIFVNPIQFGPQEDFSRYPRPLNRDLALCQSQGADLVFLPEAADMYRGGKSVTIEEDVLSKRLCGQSRPGHFQGVCTVVAKLFNLVRPTAAVFGLKDHQQIAIIRQMVTDLNFPVKIIPGETVREEDGLAMSSRNVYLSPLERLQASGLRQALLAAKEIALDGQADASALRQTVLECLAARVPIGRVDYVEVADLGSLAPMKTIQLGHTLLALAVYFGSTRLIDNISL